MVYEKVREAVLGKVARSKVGEAVLGKIDYGEAMLFKIHARMGMWWRRACVVPRRQCHLEW